MGEVEASSLRYQIHGLRVELSCRVPRLSSEIEQALGEFSIESTSAALNAVTGSIQPYDADEVVRHLSTSATRVAGTTDLVEIYEEGERFWLIDDRWGLCELNLLKGQFRSWVLGESAAIKDGHRIAEQAALWPLSQLLRPRGLSMVPAAAVVRDGWGVMILSTFSIEPELRILARAGWKIVGQSWTALREDRGNITMLPMPVVIQRSAMSARLLQTQDVSYVDLLGEFCGCRAEQAGLDAVLLVAPGRRPLPDLRRIMPANALGALRRDWPLVELHPGRRHGQLPARIAQRCPIFDVQLSRNARDILALMEAAKVHRPATPRVSVFVTPQAQVA